MNVAFAGFRHEHIFELYKMARVNQNVKIVAAWEEDEDSKKVANSQGVVFTHETYEQLLKDSNIDIVAIGNYYGIRGEMIIKALGPASM